VWFRLRKWDSSKGQIVDVSFNQKIADLLRQMADVLEQQQANPYRINAYRRGAETLSGLDHDVRELLQSEGTVGLMRLPFIGSGLASSISEIAAASPWRWPSFSTRV